MTSPKEEPPDDWLWRRPSAADPGAESPAAGEASTAGGALPGAKRPHSADDPPPAPYSGPPPTTPPPPGWRPPVVFQPPPPRHLPPQDQEAIDAEEQQARTVTYGIGLIAGAVFLVLVCLLCSRAIV